MKDTMIKYYKHVALPACLALMFGMPLSVQAQGAEGGGQPPTQGEGAPANIDSETKEKFITAHVEIRDVQQEYSKKLQSVEDKNKAQELQQQAQTEMVEIVEDNGLSVEQYNQIAGAMRNDPELRQEIEQRAQAQ